MPMSTSKAHETNEPPNREASGEVIDLGGLSLGFPLGYTATLLSICYQMPLIGNRMLPQLLPETGLEPARAWLAH